MTTTDVLEAAKPWMQQCGRCDADMPMACTCPPSDPRSLISRMVAEITQLREYRNRLLRDRLTLQSERDDARNRLHAVRMIKVWRNEDGKDFVFTDDLWHATNPEINPKPSGER